MLSDYLVSGGGLALSVSPLVMFDLSAVTAWIFGLMSVGFAAHGLDVVRRQRTRVETDEGGLWVSPPPRRIAWNEVTRFALAYFSTRRDGARGWMELKVASPVTTLRVDSRLERFDELVGRARAAALRGGVELDLTTRTNLVALGLPVEGPTEERAGAIVRERQPGDRADAGQSGPNGSSTTRPDQADRPSGADRPSSRVGTSGREWRPIHRAGPGRAGMSGSPSTGRDRGEQT